VALPAFAAERRAVAAAPLLPLSAGARCTARLLQQQSVDRYLLSAGRSAANPPQQRLAGE